jgi:tryptophan synthase alpha subunit
MFIAVLGVLDNFKSIWQAVTAFTSARNALAAAIADIRAEELKQSGTTTGITENKRLARQAMCTSAAIVGGAVAQSVWQCDDCDSLQRLAHLIFTG